MPHSNIMWPNTNDRWWPFEITCKCQHSPNISFHLFILRASRFFSGVFCILYAVYLTKEACILAVLVYMMVKLHHSVRRGHPTAHNTVAQYLFYLSSRDVVDTRWSHPCLVTQNSVPRHCEHSRAAAARSLVSIPLEEQIDKGIEIDTDGWIDRRIKRLKTVAVPRIWRAPAVQQQACK